MAQPQFLSRLARIGSASRRAALPLGLGALAATGFQPLMLWPLALVALALLIERIERSTGIRQAAWTGWLFGVGHFTLGNNWIATAFTYQAQMPAWLGWIAVVLLALYLAIFPALAAAAASAFTRRTGAAFAPAFAACWVVSEWLRGWVFTGFPWNPLGVIALGPFDRPGLARIAAWTGTYALSGLVLLLAASWRGAVHAARQGRFAPAVMAGLAPVALLLLPLGRDSHEGHVAYTVVQPDARQDQIDDPRLYERQFATLANLSPRLPGSAAAPRLVIWPEGGVPDYLRNGYDAYWYADTTFAADPALARARMAQAVGQGSLLLTGATDLAFRHRHLEGAWNVMTALDERGVIRGGYAKAHLVPYGEYLPMRELLTPLGLSRLVAGSIDYLPGPGPRTLDLGAFGHAGFQICYEIVFSGAVVDRAHRPDYIVNPSNDGWFGAWGPPQHLAQARLRAIEEGLPVLRATTTGISAVVDANGAVRQALPRMVAGRLDGMIPPPHAPTLFAQFGNSLGLSLSVVVLLLALVAKRRRRA